MTTHYFYGGPFSNMVGGPFVIGRDGLTMQYRTVEHFYQASTDASTWDHLMGRAA